MKKYILFCLIIIFPLTTGCSTMQAKIKKPQGYSYQAPRTISSQPKTDSNKQVMNAINDMGDKIVAAINQGRQTAKPANGKKKPPTSLFEDKKEKQITKKIRVFPKYENKKLKKLKDRVANLEEIVYYHHPGSDIISVKYKAGSGLLSTEEKINIKKLYEEEWLNGECDIEGLYSYASKTKPKPPLTNMQFSQLRLQEMINFLKELGFPDSKLEKLVIENRGPTNRWNYNIKVTIKVTWIKNTEEIEKRKTEREQYAPPSKNQP